jgi:hypothetical protein
VIYYIQRPRPKFELITIWQEGMYQMHVLNTLEMEPNKCQILQILLCSIKYPRSLGV